jgi:hypothetical protein
VAASGTQQQHHQLGDIFGGEEAVGGNLVTPVDPDSGRGIDGPAVDRNSTGHKRVGQLRKELRMRDGPYTPMGCMQLGSAIPGTRDAPVRHTWVYRNTYLQPSSIGYSHMVS